VNVDLRDRQAQRAGQIAERWNEQIHSVQRRARPWRSIIAATLALLAAPASYTARNAAGRHPTHDLMWTMVYAGTAVAFFVFAIAATLGLSAKTRQLLQPRVGNAHATMIRVALVIAGWGTVLTVTLDLFRVPVGRLLVGGALTGVLLGIAAQQSLQNLFAGVVILLARPFEVGDEVRLSSGPLGGSFEGRVVEIGLTYVRLETDDGITHLPNAQVLSAAAGPRPESTPLPSGPTGSVPEQNLPDEATTP
jgi:small-conductance mechanosensitive channel